MTVLHEPYTEQSPVAPWFEQDLNTAIEGATKTPISTVVAFEVLRLLDEERYQQFGAVNPDVDTYTAGDIRFMVDATAEIIRTNAQLQELPVARRARVLDNTLGYLGGVVYEKGDGTSDGGSNLTRKIMAGARLKATLSHRAKVDLARQRIL